VIMAIDVVYLQFLLQAREEIRSFCCAYLSIQCEDASTTHCPCIHPHVTGRPGMSAGDGNPDQGSSGRLAGRLISSARRRSPAPPTEEAHPKTLIRSVHNCHYEA
jgi:hypothetical protein